MIVDPDAATRPNFQPCVNRQLVFRSHTNSEDDELSRKPLAGIQADDQALCGLFYPFGRLAQQQRDAFAR